MAPQLSEQPQPPYPPERFVVEVFAELSRETIQTRWQEVNVLLRLSMLTGLHMQLDATLNLLCDLAREVAPFERALVFFWDEGEEQMRLRVTRGMEADAAEKIRRANTFNFWAIRYSHPLLIERGLNPQADDALDIASAESALVVPLFVSNRVIGSLQLFGRTADSFVQEHAQLLWIMSLVGENLLTREHANEGLLHFAFTDFLTGLKTRGYFEQQLDNEIKRSERKGLKFTLMMLDLDYFKQLNDTMGHHVGDQVLRDVGAMLVKDMREVDTVARYGGEEFVIVLPETTGASAMQVAERIRRSIEQAEFLQNAPAHLQHLTISIGIAVFDTDARFKRELIECADLALYAAKSRGRNQIVLYSEMQQQRQQQQKEVS